MLITDIALEKMFRLHSPYEATQLFSRKAMARSVADILLHNEASAIYHIDPTRKIGPWVEKPMLLAANYFESDEDARYKIIVQNVQTQCGPWVLFRPPETNSKTFYLENQYSREKPARFHEQPPGIHHISNTYLCIGNPSQVFDEFSAKGYMFVDEPCDDRVYAALLETVPYTYRIH